MREYPDRKRRTDPAQGSGFDRSMRKDKKGRIGVKPTRAVDDLPADAAVETVVSKLNELLQALRDAGQTDGGR